MCTSVQSDADEVPASPHNSNIVPNLFGMCLQKYLMALGELTPVTGFPGAALSEPPGTVTGAATVEPGRGTPVAWSRGGAGAGALTTVSDAADLNDEEGTAGLPLGAATAELALGADCSRSRLSNDTSEPLRECLRSLLLDFASFFSSFFSSCRS